MVTWKVRNLTQFSFALFMTTGISATVVYAQQPPQSDIRPEDTRQAWERTDYGSGPDRRLDLSASKNQEFYLYGWIEYGLGANNWGAPFNGPITLGDRNWQGQLNQL